MPNPTFDNATSLEQYIAEVRAKDAEALRIKKRKEEKVKPSNPE